MNQQGFDFNKLCEEAQNRWLKPPEVYFILQNYESYPITSKAPQKPPSGSLFLFNKRVLRYFRKDGHNWRKKKDGRNVGEAHERLKVGNVDALNCYYAHGEQNPCFQRRSYWMLDSAYEHIVLVHYREVSEGRFICGSTLNTSTDSYTLNQCASAKNKLYQSISHEQYDSNGYYSSSGTVEEVSSEFAISNSRNSNQSPQSDVNLALRKLAVQLSLEDADDGNSAAYFGQKLPAFPIEYDKSQEFAFLDNKNREFIQESQENHLCGVDFWEKQDVCSSKQLLNISGTNFDSIQPSWNNVESSSNPLPPHANSSKISALVSVLESSHSKPTAYEQTQERDQFTWPHLNHGVNNGESNKYPILESNSNLQLSAAEEFLLGPENFVDPPTSTLQNSKSQMQKFRIQNSMDWVAAIDLDVSNNMHSSDLWSDQEQFDTPLHNDSSLTLAENKMFCIREISPEWAFSSESTKVIVTGDFLCNSSDYSWAIMFGDILVPANVIQEGVLCCIAPQNIDGKVPLCVTCGNQIPCSESKEFEFRAKPVNSEELLLLTKLACLLICDSSDNCSLDWILQELLKEKLQQWLSSKDQGKDSILSKKEQGIIHLISSLGYEWALNPILNFGVGVNYRDANGWTALHWAARFGREGMVAALLAAGASAGAVTDATPLDRVGKTAGAIAADYGHMGLAGYLSEASLTSHLSVLSVAENEISVDSTQSAVESISQRSSHMHFGGTEDELSLKDSLAAVRNATQAAARIQAAFRAHSFRRRHQRAVPSHAEYDMYGISGLPKFRSAGHGSRDQNFDRAALSIQKKYRGWKGRKDFLTLRQHVVNIQAHVRGYQERKKYKQFVWTVSMLEKVVLRWRRKGVGLRGYKAEPELSDDVDEEIEDIVKSFRKQKVDAAVDQAVSRVLSVVESPTARQQYRRMLERFHQAEAESSTSDEAISVLTSDFEIMDNYDFQYE